MKIAFTSCSKIARDGQHTQPIWGIINQQQPDLLLLLGDNVYIGKGGYEACMERKREILTHKYEAQTNEIHFKELVHNVPYLAIWDNHDFGLPGGGYEPNDPNSPNLTPIYGAEVSQAHREMARDLFNIYLKNDSQQPNTTEIYCSHSIIDENKKEIKLYMLDVRSHQKDPDKSSPSLLGRTQENWLLNELENSTADINIISSGIPYKYWKKYERWVRAFEMVASKKAKIMFIGGQVHHNEFNIHELSGDSWFEQIFKRKRKMYESVSSGVGQNQNRPNEIEDEDEVDEPFINNSADIIANTSLYGLPLNNYGIIDITENFVMVTLYGQSAKNMHYAVINRQRWKINGYWKMKK